MLKTTQLEKLILTVIGLFGLINFSALEVVVRIYIKKWIRNNLAKSIR